MGQTYSNQIPKINHNAISFNNDNNFEKNCIFNIKIDKFDMNEIENIKNELKKIDNTYINSKTNDIIEAYTYTVNNEFIGIVSQIDSYVFLRNNLPLLEISNKNAVSYRNENNIKNDKSFSANCQLDRIWIR